MFPETLLRGISKKDFITSEGTPSALVYFPDERSLKSRNDGNIETSINWEDDQNVLGFTLNNFPNGVTRLNLSDLIKINSYPASLRKLSFERSPDLINNNPYHGNILFCDNLSKPVLRMISASLALASSIVINKQTVKK